MDDDERLTRDEFYSAFGEYHLPFLFVVHYFFYRVNFMVIFPFFFKVKNQFTSIYDGGCLAKKSEFSKHPARYFNGYCIYIAQGTSQEAQHPAISLRFLNPPQEL